MTRPTETARAIAAATHGVKPVLAAFMGGEDVLPGREELVAASIPIIRLRSASGPQVHGRLRLWRLHPPRIVTRFPVNRRRVERIISRQIRPQAVHRRGQGQGHPAGLRLCRARRPPGEYGRRGGRGRTANRLSLAMKIVSPDIIHKRHRRRQAESKRQEGRCLRA